MTMKFWKMHGAGNDFIIIDDRPNNFPEYNQKFIAKICARRTGIGCEGMILIREDAHADFAMRFFNPDGKEASMCGNGARCIARLAAELGIAPPTMAFATQAGLVRADLLDDGWVRLHLPPPTDYRHGCHLTLADKNNIAYDFINTGVPHAVVTTTKLADYPVERIGIAIVKHADFYPEQTNVNFVEIIDRQTLKIRTFERGVEAETLACGTGITATAITLALRNDAHPPVKLHTAGGDVLSVDFNISNGLAENVTLSGPAAHVFTGALTIPDKGSDNE